MATFYEVKQLLCRLFGHRDIEDNDDDITVELRSYRGECENRQITISNTELLKLYNKEECKIVCVKSNCADLFYAPYWGKQLKGWISNGKT